MLVYLLKTVVASIPFELLPLIITTISFERGSFIWYVRIICQTTNLFYPLLGTPTCAYQGGSNVSFSENFAYVLNDS